jgi:hypothetical protein
MLRPLLVTDKVALRFDAQEELPPLLSDEGKLSQILRNLISNALKFTERGEIRVSAYLSEDRRQVEFAVADTGIGIRRRGPGADLRGVRAGAECPAGTRQGHRPGPAALAGASPPSSAARSSSKARPASARSSPCACRCACRAPRPTCRSHRSNSRSRRG